MSFKEKSAWIMAVIAAVVYFIYLGSLLGRADSMPLTEVDYVSTLLWTIGLMIVAAVFISYTFGGPYMPDVIAHKGASLVKGMSHYWLSTEGVFGVALGVSTGMVFMFVLFGALLEKAGAGNYFIRVAFAALGHLRGGPAKAAIVERSGVDSA